MPEEPYWVQTACVERPRLYRQALHIRTPANVSQVDGQGKQLPTSCMAACTRCMKWLGNHTQKLLLCQLHNPAETLSSIPPGS